MAVSKRALRQMAYQSDRRPELAAVLHDALLETYPEEYLAAIDQAERIADEFRREPYYVVFMPTRLRSGERIFQIYSGWGGSGRPSRGPRELARVVREAGHADPHAVATYSTSFYYPIGGSE